MILDKVRSSLLAEAKLSPNLLSDLAGLEQYIAESYHTRSFAELLQNADDANSSRFRIQRVGDYVLVANDGRTFTYDDFESLCRSANSSKVRGNSIGYRGIGFKSVVSFAKSIYLFSGVLEAEFSREKTAAEIPQAKRVPLIRIPHPIDNAIRVKLQREISEIISDGYTTVFVFGDLIASEIEAEFEAFNFTSLLFLRTIRLVEFWTSVETIVTVKRHSLNPNSQQIRLVTEKGISVWTVVKDNDVALAFAHDESGICRLKEIEAIAHAFLPTEETTGLAIKINGDFSTDPSRRQIIFDERTIETMGSVAKLIVDVMYNCLQDNSQLGDASRILNALVPIVDPRVLVFKQRSFGKELLNAIQQAAETTFYELHYRPEWLNSVDFQLLAKKTGIWFPEREVAHITNITGFLRFVGASEATLNDLSKSLASVSPSILGCVEIVTHLIKQFATKQIQILDISQDWQIWPVGDKSLSLDEAKSINKPLSQQFVDMISERIVSLNELRHFLEQLTDIQTVQILLPHKPKSSKKSGKGKEGTTNDSPVEAPKRKPISLKKWRSGEQQVLDLLNAQGYILTDVGRQNLGYDLEGNTPDGNTVFIEVKSIDYPGQTFTLTNNEIAAALEKNKAYFLALVHQGSDALNVALIEDPANQLEMVRKCRQWVWECSSYDFQPESFPLDG